MVSLSLFMFKLCLFCVGFSELIAEDASCTLNHPVICIGLETFGQSLCRQAIAQNLNIIGAFNIHQELSPQSLSSLFNLKDNDNYNKCYQNIYTKYINELNDFISTLSFSARTVTALISDSSTFESLNNIIAYIRICLLNSINVITINTPNLFRITSITSLHQLAISNNVFLKSSGLSYFLYDIFPNKSVNWNMEYSEIIGRITCNADWIGYIHRNSKPNVFNNWYIGERIELYYDNARDTHFYKLLNNDINMFIHLLLDINDTDWIYTFQSKALHDKHGETVSSFLNRQIETGRITGIRYNARLINYDNDNNNNIHIIFKIGLFRNINNNLLKPCYIEWIFANQNGDIIKQNNIQNIDIISGMMHNAINNLIKFIENKDNCGVCCNQNKYLQNKCLNRMKKLEIKSEL